MDSSSGVLVIGADGIIGKAVASRLELLGVAVHRTSRRGTVGASPLDLAGSPTEWGLPRGLSAAVICAAVAATDTCRESPAVARRVNVEGTLALGERLAASGMRIVFPSTNMVFDGTVPFTPAATAHCPKTAYGRMKSEAEAGLLALGGTTVVRLAKVIGGTLPVIDRWREAAFRGEPIRPLADLRLAPVSLDLAAKLLAAAAIQPLGDILQLSARGDVSYADVAARYASRWRIARDLIRPATARELELPIEHLPPHTTLDSSSVGDKLGISAPDPWAAFDAWHDDPDGQLDMPLSGSRAVTQTSLK